jgi:antitoxin MazE
MSEVIVGKWGKNLAIRVPGEVAKEARLHAGERLDVQTRDSEIVIRRAAPRLTIEDMFRGKSPEEWRREYAGAYDWGADVGREIIDE